MGRITLHGTTSWSRLPWLLWASGVVIIPSNLVLHLTGSINNVEAISLSLCSMLLNIPLLISLVIGIFRVNRDMEEMSKRMRERFAESQREIDRLLKDETWTKK